MTSRRARRGVSLIELLVALAVGGLVLSAVVRVTLSAVRSSDRTRERLRQQALFRESAGLLARELSGLDPATDLGASARESLTVRAVRGTGRSCGTDAGAVVMAMSTYRAWRLPDPARDSVRVRLPEPAAAPWATAALLGAVTRSRCRDGSPGLRLPLDGALVARAERSDLPLRVVEWMRIRLYESGGQWWLGVRSLRPGDITQPAAGPFLARGLEFRFADGSGAPAAVGPDVRSIALMLRAEDAIMASARSMPGDSIEAWIAVDGRSAP